MPIVGDEERSQGVQEGRKDDRETKERQVSLANTTFRRPFYIYLVAAACRNADVGSASVDDERERAHRCPAILLDRRQIPRLPPRGHSRHPTQPHECRDHPFIVAPVPSNQGEPHCIKHPRTRCGYARAPALLDFSPVAAVLSGTLSTLCQTDL